MKSLTSIKKFFPYSKAILPLHHKSMTTSAVKDSIEIGDKSVTASIIRNLELVNADSKLIKLSSVIKDNKKPTVVIFLRHLG